jgi:ABC-2 type transport system permease protein
MISLLWKEINGFFSSITGYLVIITFLLINASFLWLFSGNFNLIESGYASIDGLFLISPWVFMFLIPAITMRLFADEKTPGYAGVNPD